MKQVYTQHARTNLQQAGRVKNPV